MLSSRYRLLNLKLLLLLLSILVACGSPANLSLENQISDYLYQNQPTTGSQFVAWADENLAGYSADQVYRAMHTEGRAQAELGHPNVVGVLSFAAQAWATKKGLPYNADDWQKLQQEAKSNMRDIPSGELQLWPPE